MVRVRKLLASLGLCAFLSPMAGAQTLGEHIDLYFSDWHAVAPHKVQGALEEREIFTRGNSQNPEKKGAVLHIINGFSYDTLAPRASTTPTKLNDQQEIFYIESGKGTVSAGGENVDLGRNIAVLMPANLEYTMKSTGDKPLCLYIIKEPTPEGFRPNSAMLVRDANKIAFTTTDSHWSHMDKPLFTTADGLASLESVIAVTMDPLTIGQPHLTDHPDIEEVWTALHGTSLAFVGNQLRRQTPGMAFYHIPDNKTPHTNVNYNEDSEVTFLYFAYYHPHQPRP
jgi:mannose-6-phosphate isomerase-like protein (cupin superfamily)